MAAWRRLVLSYYLRGVSAIIIYNSGEVIDGGTNIQRSLKVVY